MVKKIRMNESINNITLLDFLNQFVPASEFISVFDSETDNLFNGTVKEFLNGAGDYPYVIEYGSSDFDKLSSCTVMRIGINYNKTGLQIIVR